MTNKNPDDARRNTALYFIETHAPHIADMLETPDETGALQAFQRLRRSFTAVETGVCDE